MGKKHLGFKRVNSILKEELRTILNRGKLAVLDTMCMEVSSLKDGSHG